MQEENQNQLLHKLAKSDYKYGFTTDIPTEFIEKGLNEKVVRLISEKKNEPDWLLDFRLKAYHHWLTMDLPTWAHLNIPPIDFQDIIYYAAPQQKKSPQSRDEIDPELLKTFERLGIPLEEQKQLAGVAVDAVMDSVSVKTTFKEILAEKGIIFCSFNEAVQHHPDLVKKYLGSVVPYKDNFYAALNSAVFSDGSFVYIPEGVRCPMELSTYFRINAPNTGQFERTLIIADNDSYVSYLEGCTAPMRDENQLHAAVVEIIALENAEVKYSPIYRSIRASDRVFRLSSVFLPSFRHKLLELQKNRTIDSTILLQNSPDLSPISPLSSHNRARQKCFFLPTPA